MDAIRIEPGTRYWPSGLDDLLGDAPPTIEALSAPELLLEQSVLVSGSPGSTPRGLAVGDELAGELGRTDLVIAGDIGNASARSAVVAAARSGGRGVLFSRWPADELGDLNQGWADDVTRRGGAVVFLTDGSEPLPSDQYQRALAAYSTVVLVPESDGDPRSQGVAIAAADLGRGVAVVRPPGRDVPAYAGSEHLLGLPHVTMVDSSRDVAVLVGPAPVAVNELLLRELDHLEFSTRMAQLREAGRIDASTERAIYEIAHESGSLAEFHARIRYAGPRMLGATEHRYLLSAIETPEGRRPETWAECAAYVRAYGVDQYESAREIQRMERDRELSFPGLGLRP